MSAATSRDVPAHRRTFSLQGPLALECGRSLPEPRVAFETWGELNGEKTNAVLVIHALTGDAHALSHGEGDGARGWWEGLIGPGRALDPARDFVVCANLVGSCYGSTGPSDPDPGSGRPFGPAFPAVTTRDMARAQKALLDHLGVREVALALGGSLGAMVAWELAAEFPGFVRRIAPIAGTPRATPWSIALNEVARGAIFMDPGWEGGNYDGAGPTEGLALARGIAMITYRTDALFEARFGREREDADPEKALDPSNLFQVQRYLAHQGRKLVGRFDARSYVALTRAMDLHDVARGRGDFAGGLGSIGAEVLCVGISTDILYSPRDMRESAESVARAGGRAKYAEIASPFGHDAFLVEFDQLDAILGDFLGK